MSTFTHLVQFYAKALLKEAFVGTEEGIRFGSRLENSVRFADDKAIVSESEDGLLSLYDSKLRF